MPKKTFTTEHIISKLREAKVLLSQDQPLPHLHRPQGYPAYRRKHDNGWVIWSRDSYLECTKTHICEGTYSYAAVVIVPCSH